MEQEKIPSFSELTSTKYLTGIKSKIADVLDKQITVYKFDMIKSAFKDDYLKIQFKYHQDDPEFHVVNTGSNCLINQIRESEIKAPFTTTIIKIKNYYKFT